MNIAILGPGAMGCLYGGRLALAGHEVTMIGRNPEKMKQLQTQGIIIEEDGICKTAAVKAVTASEFNGSPELLLLFTKTTQAEDAMASMAGRIGPDTFLLTLQNGLGNEEFLLPYADRSRILVGTCIFPADIKKPGHIVTQKDGETRFAPLDAAENILAEKFAEDFTQAGLNCCVDPAVFQRIWEKTALNCAMNCLTAICRVPCGKIAEVPGGKELVEAIISEAVQTAGDAGYRLSEEHIRQMVGYSFTEHKNHYTSMAQDIMNHKETEADRLCGAVIRQAHQYGREVPRLETLQTIVKIIEKGYL